MKVSLKEIRRRLNPHIHGAFDDASGYKIEHIDASSLMVPGRFDLGAKLIVARHHRLGRDMEWPKRVYREHLIKWNGRRCIEPDGSGKEGFDNFYSTFVDIYESQKNKGFDEKESILPVNPHGILMDGAHRASAAIDLGLQVPAVKAKNNDWCFDYRYFRNLGLRDEYLDSMALEYIERSKNVYTAYLFPVKNRDDKRAIECINEIGEVFYERDIYLSRIGTRNLTTQLYRDEPWVGSPSDGFSGAKLHAKNRFVHGEAVRCVYFTSDDLDSVIEAKARIRSIYDHGNFPVHINDSQEEALRLSRLILNPNGLHFINHAKLDRYPDAYHRLNNFRRHILDNRRDPHDYMIDSSFVMMLYGLREAGDIDYLHRGEEIDSLGEIYASHNDSLSHYPYSLNQILDNPCYYLFFDGVKISSLGLLLDMKKRRGEKKDRLDVKLIENVYRPPSFIRQTFNNAVLVCEGYLNDFDARFRRLVRSVVPERFRPALRSFCQGVIRRR